MQSITRRFLTSPLRTSSPLKLSTPTRTFTTSSLRLIKEDKVQDPEELDRIKNEQIQKQKEGKGHWHEELASAGEASIGADREKVDDHDKHMEDLQKETAEKSEKEHPQGKKQ